MTKLIFIHGPNGVGKSSTCKALHNRLKNSAWLESEWARTINPFILNDETAKLTEDNMTYILRNYLNCSMIDYVIFNFGFHGRRKEVFDRVMNNLKDIEFEYIPITITCDKDENVKRMTKDGRSQERISRAVSVRHIYEGLGHKVVDSTARSISETVEEIIEYIQSA